tara:strand:+ start:407 stop:754 length:348 start_codon:yes stop_codon:yes gene_type:complete
MADELDSNTPASGDNSNARKQTILEVCATLDDLDAQRKQISDKAREVKNKRIKGDLGMKISDFNIARRLYSLEGDHRDEMLDTIRETFDALGVGEQLDFIAAGERMEAKRTPEAA